MAPFCLLVPFWLLFAYCGWRRAIAVWPAALVVGGAYASTQLLISNLHGPWLASVVPALVSVTSLVGFLRVWRPAVVMHVNEAPLGKGDQRAPPPPAADDPATLSRRVVWKAWMPWLILTALVFLWGLPTVKQTLDGLFSQKLPFPYLDGAVMRTPPVVASPQVEAWRSTRSIRYRRPGRQSSLRRSRAANCLECARVSSPAATARFLSVIPALITIAAMLALGNVTRFSGLDATMGLAFAATGIAYPYFGTMLGWLGTAVTGSDTASNILFGSLQRITAEQLHLSPVLMASANSAGGVMGKMIDTQSIVVASTATQWFGQESRILR